MNTVLQNLNWERTTGVLIVLAVHGAVLYGLWSANLISKPDTATTVFVNLIDPPLPPPQRKETFKRVPLAPVKLDKPRPPEPRLPEPSQQLVAEAPVVSPTEAVAPSSPASTMITAPAPPAPSPKPAEPINLTSDLSVSCPVRTAPTYPALARRMGEEGEGVLRVELSEDGQIASVRVSTSSGFRRLDQAALAAIKNWRCNAAQRDGQPVRAVAIQPFKFSLEGR